VLLGESAVLHWNVQAATSQQITAFVIKDAAGNTVASGPLPAGSANSAALSGTTTFTATATQTDGQQATATVTVSTAQLLANPNPISPGDTTTLRWNFPGASSVSINNNICPPGTCTAPTGSITTGPLRSTTTFTATPNVGSPASVKVQVSGLQSLIKHIIFLVQENRSFDNYFGRLGAYRAAKLGKDPKEVEGFSQDCGAADPATCAVVNQTKSGFKAKAFHERTVCTDNLTPSWGAGHFDVHIKGSWINNPKATFSMDRFPLTANNVNPSPSGNDPDGTRAMGYYDETDLPYYYELATQFATSDMFFSPVLSGTVNNRMYLFAGTSFGHVHPDDTRPATGWTQATIFRALNKAGISWRYYYQDSSVFLADFADWNDPKIKGKVVNINAPVLGWFNVLSSPTADRDLPQVIFIERGSNPGKGQPLLDEHPLGNIQIGAATVKKILDALMNSSAWQSSAFILTYDEGGGLFDHVPPQPTVAPDDIAPILREGDTKADFTFTGQRLPFILVSPWAKPQFVSHKTRDFTAILKFIQTRFGMPSLTARDAAQDDMTEFFDFAAFTPPLLTPPGGGSWSTTLPAQPTNGVCSFKLEEDPSHP
jgi:phospholipase C